MRYKRKKKSCLTMATKIDKHYKYNSMNLFKEEAKRRI